MTPVEFCDSTATRLHETFQCLEPAGHDGKHRGPVYYGDPCPGCGAYDVHSDDCTTPDVMEDQSQPLYETTWGEDGVVILEPYSRPR